MHVVIRADSSSQIGAGHVARCLVLARELARRGASVTFVSRNVPGHSGNLILEQGHSFFLIEDEVQKLPDADWLVVDHYGLDIAWERRARAQGLKILVIEDLKTREHECDVLLVPSVLDEKSTAFNNLVPQHSKKLIGPRFALVREEFKSARKNKIHNANKIEQMLVFFGSADPTRETEKTLLALQSKLNLLKRLHVDVVVGAQNKRTNEIKSICSALPNTHCHIQTDRMAELMLEADYSIGAGGTSVWERSCVGLPSSIIAVGENQISIASELGLQGYHYYLGESHDVTADMIAKEIDTRISNVSDTIAVGQKSMQLIDGDGAKRVCDYLIKGESA